MDLARSVDEKKLYVSLLSLNTRELYSSSSSWARITTARTTRHARAEALIDFLYWSKLDRMELMRRNTAPHSQR